MNSLGRGLELSPTLTSSTEMPFNLRLATTSKLLQSALTGKIQGNTIKRSNIFVS